MFVPTSTSPVLESNTVPVTSTVCDKPIDVNSKNANNKNLDLIIC